MTTKLVQPMPQFRMYKSGTYAALGEIFGHEIVVSANRKG